MLKKLLFTAALLVPSLTHGQVYLQNVTTADYSLRTTLTQLSPTSYLYSAQLRNEQLYDPTRVFGINNVVITGVNDWSRGESHNAVALGSVFTGPIPSLDPAHNVPIQFFNAFGIDAYNGQGRGFYGTDSDELFNGYGLLGCSIPDRLLGTGGNTYNGDTCASAGFTGWWTINVTITYAQPTAVDASAFSTTLRTAESRVSTHAFAVVPEPATYALMGFGLLAVGIVRRKSARSIDA